MLPCKKGKKKKKKTEAKFKYKFPKTKKTITKENSKKELTGCCLKWVSAFSFLKTGKKNFCFRSAEASFMEKTRSLR